jgi:hypothetical protein
MNTFIKDIESFFSGLQPAVTSPAASSVTAAASELVKKSVALAQTANHLAQSFSSDAETTWSSLDGQSLTDVATSVTTLVQSGDYEKAAFGLLYLVYQGAIEATNTVEAQASADESAVSADVQAVEQKVATATATTAGPAATGVVAKVEAVAEKLASEVTTEVTKVVGEVKELFRGNTPAPVAVSPTTVPAAPAEAAAPVTPVVASVIPAPAASTAPVVAAANPPVTPAQTAAPAVQAS